MRSPTLDEKIGLALERQEKIPERVRRCTTHHHACDCREYEFEQAKARIEALEDALHAILGEEVGFDETESLAKIFILARQALEGER